MTFLSDGKTLLALARGAAAGASHEERLRRFYGPQAHDYDRFREQLLPWRAELIASLPVAAGAQVAELGAGTGRNLEFFGPRLQQLAKVYLVDLCEPLLDVARRRFSGVPNVWCVQADASAWQPDAAVDALYFSYSLTMMPNWRGAIDNAIRMLKDGGMLGVVDFCVTSSQALLAQAFWTRWFAHDGVHLSLDHLPYLRSRLQPLLVEERRAHLPYLPGLSVPYYLFIGSKRG